MDLEPLAGRSGRELARTRSDRLDGCVRALCGDVASGVAVAAVGGYGRREQTPGSDVDLLFLHGGDDPSLIGRLVDAVLYPLWDAGVPVSHSVRTLAECRHEAAARVESLTALLDARVLAGSAELVGRASELSRDVVRQDTARFVEALRRSRGERDRRFGSVGRTLEPDLKEGLGGMRDVQVLRWLATVADPTDEAGDGDGPIRPPEALDHLLLVRMALHRASSSRSNRLLAEHHEPVAALLGIQDEPDWEARDRLMRAIFVNGRWIEHLTDQVLGSSRQGGGSMTVAPRDLVETICLEDGAALLRAEDAVGTLRHRLPGWEDVRGRPQRDPYHRYPVDVHLLETLAEAARLIREPDEPFAVEAAAEVGHPAALLLGALLHDIGKVGRGSHVPRGIEAASSVMLEMGVGGDLRDDVLFLVGEHLLLSDTATRRNLEDEDLIVHVAARVGDERRLALLYLLTVSDAHATGPAASSPWRLGLVRELVAKVSHAFERGLMDRDRATRLEAAEATLREALASSDRPTEEIDAFLTGMPPGYVLWVAPSDVARHLGLVVPRPGPVQVRMSVRPSDALGTYRVSLGAMDRRGFLAAVSGSMTLSGLSILHAQAFTTEDGLALDVFDVRGAFEEEVREERWERFSSMIGDALRGTLNLGERVRSLRAHYPPASADVPVTVSIDHEASDFYSVVEVSASDRLGLLFDLASVMADHDLDVHVAKVSTYGPRVVDVFYVRDSAGQKVNDAARAAQLERSLIAAASHG